MSTKHNGATASNGARLTSVSSPDRPAAAVLVCHGGAANSTKRVRPLSPAALRLIPVARAVATKVPTAAVYRLRFSVRGWNGDGSDVLGDARWALEQIVGQHPALPLVVVGHSLGGRVAMHLAGMDVGSEPTSRVVGAVGLAPWVNAADPVALLAGVPLSVVQGTRDRIVPEPSTRPWLANAVAAGAVVTSTIIEGGGHAMLRFHRRWHQLTADGVASVMAAADHPVTRA